MIALICLLLSFLYVFLRALQQLNVMHNRYAWVLPVSLGLGLCDVALILYGARPLSKKLPTPNHYLDAMDIEIIAAALANEEQRVWDVVEQHFTTGDPG